MASRDLEKDAPHIPAKFLGCFPQQREGNRVSLGGGQSSASQPQHVGGREGEWEGVLKAPSSA